MTSSSAGGVNGAIDAYKQAVSDRKQLVSDGAPYDQISAAMDKETEAANNVVSKASDADFDYGAKKYFDDLGYEDGLKKQEK